MSLAVPSMPGAVRLSRSALWEAQRRFYERAGPEVFTAGVLPYQVTSNPAIAQAYARLIAAWLQDLRSPVRGDGDTRGAEPRLTIVEIGPGSGRFTYQLLSALARVLPGHGGRAGDVGYVCADISPALLDGIRRHPANRRWVDDGTLRFAVADADQSGKTTSAGESLAALLKTGGPVVVVANYVFDSLPQDAFYVSNGQVWQTLVRPLAGDVASEPIARWRLTFEQHPAERPYYGDGELDALLTQFTDGHTGSLLFPVGSLLFLRELLSSAGDRPLLLLAADKACTPGAPETQVPHLEFHGDHCFSMAVNFEVIDAAWQRGGSVLKRADAGEFLAIRVFQSGPATGSSVKAAFAECVECNAPDDWFLWSLRIGRDVHTYSLADMMAVLRLSAYDPAVLNDCFTMMFRWLPGATAPERAQLRRILRRVMDNYYFLGEHPDVAFEVGSLLYAIGAHDEALARLVESEALSGPRPATLYQQARCLYHLGDKRAALRRLQAARTGGEDFEQFLMLSGILDQPRAREFEQRLTWEVSVEGIGS